MSRSHGGTEELIPGRVMESIESTLPKVTHLIPLSLLDATMKANQLLNLVERALRSPFSLTSFQLNKNSPSCAGGGHNNERAKYFQRTKDLMIIGSLPACRLRASDTVAGVAILHENSKWEWSPSLRGGEAIFRKLLSPWRKPSF
jgi:hypothetical protein